MRDYIMENNNLGVWENFTNRVNTLLTYFGINTF